MQFFRDSNIPFMQYRRYWVGFSALLLLFSVFMVFVRGQLNLGIDFAGGTQLTLKFKAEQEIEEIRRIVTGAGPGDAVIQRLGDPGSGELLIKTRTAEEGDESSRAAIVGALDGAFNASVTGLDLNRAGAATLTDFLVDRDPEGRLGANDAGDAGSAVDGDAVRDHYTPIADSIQSVRRDQGLIRDWSDLDGVGVSSETLAALRSGAGLGEYAILGAENVTPQIGAELRQRGILAIVFSLLGMLAYIWFRFELRYGVGALVAVVHDVLITLGLFALTGLEFNLTTIAGFLTLVGYSVNDSVVVFDRVRENLRRSRSRSLEETMNLSLNQTLSRTVLTSGTTLLAVGSLWALGGDVLRGFGFILTVGVIIGTYSSMYVASPFALLWERIFGRQARLARKERAA